MPGGLAPVPGLALGRRLLLGGVVVLLVWLGGVVVVRVAAAVAVVAVVVLGPGAEDEPAGAADRSWPVGRTGPAVAQADKATATVKALSSGRARAWRTVIGAPLCPLDPRSSQLGAGSAHWQGRATVGVTGLVRGGSGGTLAGSVSAV